MFNLLPQGVAQAGMDMAGQMYNPATQPTQQQPMQPGPYEPQSIGLPGLLGIKGGFRDALGTIGDAMLIGGGNKPMYAPAVEQQKMAHAMQDFADDPMAAIKRVAAVNPEAGRKMLQDYVKSSTDANKTRAETVKTEFDIRSRGLNLIGGLAGAANDATMAGIKDRMIQIDKDAGLGMADLIRNAKTPAELQALGAAAITAKDRADDERQETYNQERLEDYDRTEDRQQANTASMIGSRATRDAHSAARVGQGAARVNQGERRTQAYVANAGRRGERSSGGGRGGNIPTVSASSVPSSARLGRDSKGRRVAQYDGKVVYIKD